MTVTHAVITAPLVRDVRAARLRTGVCQASDHAGRTGPRRLSAPSMTRAGVLGERTGTHLGTRQHGPIIATRAVGPFELQ
jgi:hypothetical protein